MSSNHPSRKDIESLCNDVGPEDGIDPRFLRLLPEDRHIGRKQLQLCRQVGRTLSEVLAGCGDEVLQELEVAGVTPAAGAGRMLVTLRPSASATPRNRAVIDARLARAHGMLRGEVATAVNRRKAPELLFQVIE